MIKRVSYITIFLINFFNIIYANSLCNIQAPLVKMHDNFKKNNIEISEKGLFPDIRKEEFYTDEGEIFKKYLAQYSVAEVLFEDQIQFDLFLQYLKELKEKSCDKNTIVKTTYYDDFKYRLSSSYIADELIINLNIVEGNHNDIDGYDERSYQYIFKLFQNKLVFFAINPAG